MNYYLSIIDGEYDFIGNKSENIKLSSYFKKIGFNNIRFSSLEDAHENPNDNFFYFIEDVNDLTINENNRNFWVDSNFKRELSDNFLNSNNVYIIFLNKEGSDNLILNNKIDTLLNDSNRRKKIFVYNENELTYDILYSLITDINYETLNIVYDKWSENGNTFHANLSDVKNDRYTYNKLTGLVRFYNLFNKSRSCRLEEVYSYPNLNFYYFISGQGSSFERHFYEKNIIPLSEDVKKCYIECKNFHIIMINEHEYEPEKFIKDLDNSIKTDLFDSSRVYLMNNNSKLNLYKEKNNILINLHSLDFLLKFISSHMVRLGEPRFIDDKEGNFFMCHNRTPKPHRYAILCLLKKHNLLDNVDWSMVMGWYRKKQRLYQIDSIFFSECFSPEDFTLYNNEIQYFSNIDIKKSVYEEEKTWFNDTSEGPSNIDWKDVYELKTYENSYVNIVTESNYGNDEIHITEKSIKPFYFYQLPLFLSSYNYIKYLKNRYNFDMFDDIIDHSYDNEPDNRLRLIKFFDEIKRLNSMKNEIKEFYKNNKERFIKNRERVIEIDNSKRDYDFFCNLIKKPIL